MSKKQIEDIANALADELRDAVKWYLEDACPEMLDDVHGCESISGLCERTDFGNLLDDLKNGSLEFVQSELVVIGEKTKRLLEIEAKYSTEEGATEEERQEAQKLAEELASMSK